jgi:hypothetical protein
MSHLHGVKLPLSKVMLNVDTNKQNLFSAIESYNALKAVVYEILSTFLMKAARDGQDIPPISK